MSSSSPHTSSVSQGISCALSVSSHSWEKPNMEYKQSASCNMEECVNILSENLVISPVDEKDSVRGPVVEHYVGESVNCEGCHRQISIPETTCEKDDTLISNEINICQEFSQSLSLDAKGDKCLSKCKTFPVSREIQTYSLSNGRADSPATATQGQESSASGTSAYSRSISLPSSSTLVSAMKGGWALNGTMVKSELHVKWAPEVHDPPATSMSHTVKGHQQRPKAKKKDKHKHKGKSSRGNGSERKHGSRKSFNKTIDPQNARLQADGDRQVLNGLGKSQVVDIFEYGINGQEAKCGSSFLREAIATVHLPIGEAS